MVAQRARFRGFSFGTADGVQASGEGEVLRWRQLEGQSKSQ